MNELNFIEVLNRKREYITYNELKIKVRLTDS